MNFLLPKIASGEHGQRAPVIERIQSVLRMLHVCETWEVRIEPHKPKRTTDQNNLLWSIYDDILERGGEAMGGWTKDDLHEFFLSGYFGEKEIDVFGRKKKVPLQRSKTLSKAEFAKYVDHIVRFMAMEGVVIEMPGDL